MGDISLIMIIDFIQVFYGYAIFGCGQDEIEAGKSKHQDNHDCHDKKHLFSIVIEIADCRTKIVLGGMIF